MTSIEEIENKVNNFLQTKVVFMLENKTLKKGRLILFCIKDFFCIFTLLCEEKNNKKIVYEIPYPFKFTGTENKCVFDYSLKTFSHENLELEKLAKIVIPEKPSKFFNKRITISAL